MSKANVREVAILAKAELIESMLAGIATLPLTTEAEFTADRRMPAAGESFLLHTLETLLSLGRHLLAKSFGLPTAAYEDVPRQLEHVGVLTPDLATLMLQMAVYRNRLIHLYDEVTLSELYHILTQYLGDATAVLDALRHWIAIHPERVDRGT